jgi:glycosyltransferase involved in cell wall biosynthesis
MKPSISLIISVYNKIESLKLVLSSLELQSFKEFEVILSDDGSNHESVSEINDLIGSYSFTLKHVWHPDDGWKKNVILNKSILASDSSYLIFIDGDCILHHKFIQEHHLAKEIKTVITGRRVNLSKKVSTKLSNELISNGYLNSKILRESFWDSINSKARDLEQGVYIKADLVRNFLNRKDKGILGSNFSLFKQDLLDVNGFDERFVHPAAGEDTDIEARLRRNGLQVKTIRNQAVQYHLYHKQLPRNKERLVYLDENNENKITFTPFGIKKSK